MDDDFFDFLTEEEKAQLAPASISELDSFKEYKNLVDSITSREDLINLRYPQLIKFPIAGNIFRLIGGLAVPEWFPCLLYTSPSPRDGLLSRMPSSA